MQEIIEDYFGWADLSVTVTEPPHDAPTKERIFEVSLATPDDGDDLASLKDDGGFTEDIAWQVESSMDEGEIEANITMNKD